MEDADQREETPRGVEIDLNLAFEPFLEKFGRFVMDAAPRHVDRLNLLRRRLLDRLKIAVTNREIITDRAAKAAKAENNRFKRTAVLALDIKH